MNRKVFCTFMATLCLTNMSSVVFADSIHSSNLLTLIQSDESLVAKNPTDAALYQQLGQLYEQEANSNIHVFVNGGVPHFDVDPYLAGNRMMTPIRAISEALGFSAKWDPNAKQVILSNPEHSIVLTIQSNQSKVDNSMVNLDAPAAIVKGRTFVPLRFVSENMGAVVNWYPSGQVVSINTQSSNQQTSVTSQVYSQLASSLIQAPIISQKPELYNGCEVTSTTMLLQWAGVNVTKIQAASDLEKDSTAVRQDANGNILYWGNPNTGFVGDVTGTNMGYAVYHGPIVDLINHYLPGKALDLTGKSFEEVLAYVKSGKPVVVWNTSNFQPTEDWVTWQSPNGTVRATFDEHCVLLVGYDPAKNKVLINDPLDGKQAKAIPRDEFEQAWLQLGSQAVSVK